MSIKVMTDVWANSSAKEGTLLVLLAIADFADESGRAFPSIPTIAKKSRLSERQVQYNLKNLVDSGELTIEMNAGPKGCNLFTILVGGAKTAPVQKLRGANIAPVQLPTGGVQFATGGGAMDCTRTVSEPSTEPSIKNMPPSACANAPIDSPQEFIFAVGKQLLGAKAGSVIGQARKRVGDEKVTTVLASMAAMKPAVSDPVPYFIKATQPKLRRVVV